jgi:methionyl-tRNA formyltransferase
MSVNDQKFEHASEEKNEVLFFGRANCDASSKALNHLVRLGFKVTAIFSKGHGDSLPDDIGWWSGDYIFCFRSMFILPKHLIDKAKIAAINFHPGSPEYPGSGCLNYALYENSKEYGVTSHLMTAKVDDGNIVECRRFPIHEADTVSSLLDRTHVKLLDLFFDVISGVAVNGKTYIDESIKKSTSEKWSGIKRKINDLNTLSIVGMNITKNELENLIRATYTENFPPKIILHGYEFILKLDKKK